MRKYRLVAKKGEGTFSEVLKAQNVKDGKYHAIKCMKNRFESIDQVRLKQVDLRLRGPCNRAATVAGISRRSWIHALAHSYHFITAFIHTGKQFARNTGFAEVVTS